MRFQLSWITLITLLHESAPFTPISRRAFALPPTSTTRLHGSNDDGNDQAPKVPDAANSGSKNKKRYYGPPIKSKKSAGKVSNTSSPNPMNKERKKQAVAKAAQEMRKRTKPEQKEKDSLLDIVNPFKAGKKLRQTLESLTQIVGLTQEQKERYYLDDRFQEQGPLFSERNPLIERLERSGYVPEVLVVGATGEVGRLVVRRLLLDGRFRVRVLVRDLYSKTLNLLGTGVTYCQGDLANVESLEYAVTDVDKIVFCAGAPRPDENDFQDRFSTFVKENLDSSSPSIPLEEKVASDLEWEKLESVLELRSKLAEQVDCIGMQNLVRAYQNVRFADYGSSQTAKRSLFKFTKRMEDFNLFAIDDYDGDDVAETNEIDEVIAESILVKNYGGTSSYDDADPNYDDYDDTSYDKLAEQYASGDPYAEFNEEGYEDTSSRRKGATTKVQCLWMKNQFDHAVFVGRVSKGTGGAGGGESSIISSRLSSREVPESGIDLIGFGGFIARVCSDGGTYEAFVRTASYESDGIEYICEFGTESKPLQDKNKSTNRFKTVRLPFENFQPVQRKGKNRDQVVPTFRGKDVRQIGFRFRMDSNTQRAKLTKGNLCSFYLAIAYIKVYRAQPEPEFVYLSDSRIPSVVRSGMVKHDVRQLIATPEDGAAFQIFDGTFMQADRSTEETYYKYRGEEILKNSGLSYAIVRVSGYNESPSGEASTIELKSVNDEVIAVSRADVAQVCACALLDSNALNKSFYMSKTKNKPKNVNADEDISLKFADLPTDVAM